MTASANTRIVLAAILGTLIVVGLGIGGFALGRSERTSKAAARADEQAARAQAFTAADTAAYRASWSRGYADGLRRGDHHGREAGTVAGRRNGTVVASQRAAAGASAATGCAQIPGGPCEAPGPGVTGHSCPPGSVPNADGGVVCVPQSLIEEKNTTPSVNSPEGQRALEGPECQGEPPPPPGYEGPVQC
jgi:hypothetical protein